MPALLACTTHTGAESAPHSWNTCRDVTHSVHGPSALGANARLTPCPAHRNAAWRSVREGRAHRNNPRGAAYPCPRNAGP